MLQRGPLIFLAVVLAAIVPILLRIAWPFLTAFILASIIAIVMYPVKQWLSRRIHRPGWATPLLWGTPLVVGAREKPHPMLIALAAERTPSALWGSCWARWWFHWPLLC